MSFIQYSNIKSSIGGSNRPAIYNNNKCGESKEETKKAELARQDTNNNNSNNNNVISNNHVFNNRPESHHKAYRNLGKSGLRVSNIVLGTWVTFGSQISDETAEEICTYAYEHGVNVFDTSEVYANGKAEVTLGKILKKKQWRRSSYIVVSKIFWGGKAETERGLSRKHILEGVQASLERLQLGYVDVLLANKSDPRTPMEEIARAFTHVVNQGWCMYWGTSRWSPAEIMEIYSTCRQFNLIPPTSEQLEYNFFKRDQVEFLMPELFHKIGLGLMTTSPLYGGFISGKYSNNIPYGSRASLKGFSWFKEKVMGEEGRSRQLCLNELLYLTHNLRCTLSQLAIAWCLKNESVHCVVLGASSVDQLCEDLKAVQLVSRLTHAHINQINDILETQFILSKEE